jgi:hypothetical protein
VLGAVEREFGWLELGFLDVLLTGGREGLGLRGLIILPPEELPVAVIGCREEVIL